MVRSGVALAGVGRHGPVFMERPTPDGEVQSLHDDERADDISYEDLDAYILPAQLGQAEVKDAETEFGSPDLHQSVCVAMADFTYMH